MSSPDINAIQMSPLEDEEEEVGEPEEENDDDEGGDIGTKHMIRAVPNLESLIGHRDLSRDAICWTLSSAKPGNGVDQIRDSSSETYWQSDGSQPHTLQVVFSRRVAISHVCLYLDFNIDESYTPKKVCVEVGMTVQELQTILMVELSEPVGWCILPLEAPPDPLDDEETIIPFVRTHLLQISILTMHQNGRDTHVRRVKLLGPKPATSIQGQRLLPEFNTITLSQFSVIR